MNLKILIDERNSLRNNWHNVRARRLDLKKSMIAKESHITQIRHNTEYKRLKKEQRHLATMIKHIENKLCRAIKK